MREKDRYIRMISRRGNADGTGGGLLDLLDWCGKLGLRDVTREEARRFWERPPGAVTAQAVDNLPRECGKPEGRLSDCDNSAVDTVWEQGD